MPFLALHDSSEVIPNEVEKGESLKCPKCGDQLKIRASHYRQGSFVSRHFYHVAGDEIDCGGESRPHLKMKAIAYSKLTNEYPDATVESEQRLGDRRADILVEFPEPRFPKGRGIGVEVQHKHEDKDVDAVTAEYHEEEYSILWLEDADFSGRNVDLSGVIPTWPHAVQHDFSDGYHGVIHWLRQSKPADPSIDVVFPRECVHEHVEHVRRAWHYGKFDQGGRSDWDDFGFWWLSDPSGPYKKWFKLSETPDDQTMLQLGSQARGTGHLAVPTKINSQNRDAVHSLAYAVDSSYIGAEKSIKHVRLLDNSPGPSAVLELMSRSSGELALSLAENMSSDSEYISISTIEVDDLKMSLHELANLIGGLSAQRQTFVPRDMGKPFQAGPPRTSAHQKNPPPGTKGGPKYDCPYCHFKKSSLSMSPRKYIKHLEVEHGYTNSVASGIVYE
jgi:ssDNA-binding Zn-finger/Zn-ribbon topoisomerase 1